MKKILIILSAAFIACCCSINISFGDGVSVTGGCTEEDIDFSEERTVSRFDSFKAAGPFNVYYVQSPSQKVLVEGKEEFVKKVITEVRDDELSIRLEKGKYTDLVLRVTVFSPDIEDMTESGSGNLVCREVNLPGKEIEISVLGSGDAIIGNINCKDLELSAAGSGDALVKAITVSEDAEIATAGSGDVKIESATIAGDLELSTAGSGDIRISGSCRNLEASTRGSGDISGRVQYSSIETTSRGSGKVKL